VSAHELRAIARGVPGGVWRHIVTPPNPVAGASLTVVPDTPRAWRVLTVAAHVVAANVAGNRLVTLTHKDAGGVALGTFPQSVAITQNNAADVTWGAGIGGTGGTGTVAVYATIPDAFYVLPGERLVISGLTNAGDQISAARIVAVETYVGDEWHERNIEQAAVDRREASVDLWTHGGRV
jgi:hypothetical protein